tara:strand:- start:2256 stop:2633 length:378 start_codon:yes stop_codon:yes gene_type:complete
MILGISNNTYSQEHEFPAEVEAKIAANRKAGLSSYKDVYLNYNLYIFGVNTSEEALHLDLQLMEIYSTEIISSKTTFNQGEIESHVQAFGSVSADRIKEIMLLNHADFEKFEYQFTLEKVIIQKP